MSFGAFSKILDFSFLNHNSDNNQNLKKASIRVPFRAANLSFDISFVKIGAFLLTKKLFPETVKRKRNTDKLRTSFFLLSRLKTKMYLDFRLQKCIDHLDFLILMIGDRLF